MNLRGRFLTDAEGRFDFRSVKPAGYPIPIDGPVGDLVRATGRHNYRPAHLHFMICKPGFKTLISQVYVPDDEHLDSDVQFGVTRALIGDYVRHDEPETSQGFEAPWYSLDQRFVLEPGRGPAAGADPKKGARVGCNRRSRIAPLRPTSDAIPPSPIAPYEAPRSPPWPPTSSPFSTARTPTSTALTAGTYGSESFPQIEARCRRHAESLDLRSISGNPTTRAC